jgi:hypothetical protein
MAIVQNPVTGRTKKKFATAVFSKQFGKNTMRSKPVEVANPKTLLQRQQRAKFSLMVELSRMFLSFIRTGFKQVAIGMSQFNVFMKSNIKTVITGTYPNYSIDFTKLIVAKGTLMGADTPEATAETGNKVAIDWIDNSGNGDAEATDNALVLIINYDKKAVKTDTISKTRVDELLEITVHASWIGDTVHVYLSFFKDETNAVANSSFVGSVTVIA